MFIFNKSITDIYNINSGYFVERNIIFAYIPVPNFRYYFTRNI